MSLPSIPAYALPEAPPAGPVDWTAEPSRSALLIHDLQTYFIDAFDREGRAEDGGPAQIAVAIQRIRALREAAHRAGVPVFYTAQPPRQDPADRALLTDFWGTGLQTDAQAAIIPELAPADGDIVLDKWRYSAFMRSTLREQLLARGRDRLVITGVYAHIGCLATALDAYMLDVRPFLVRDALADFTAEEHAQALRWAARRCASVQDAQQILGAWGAGDAARDTAAATAAEPAEGAR